MNDLNPVRLPPGDIRNKGTINVVKDTSTTGLSQPKEKTEIDNDLPSSGVYKGSPITSNNMKLEVKSSAISLVNKSDEILHGQNISPNLFDHMDPSLDQTDNRTTESVVNLGIVASCQQAVSGRHAQLPVRESSNGRTEFNASNTHQYSKEDTLDGIDGRKKECDLTEADERRRSKRSSTSSEKSISRGSLHDSSHTYSKLPCSAEKQQDESSTMREQIDVGTLNMDKRRHSTELDMAEIEERRRRDTKHFQEGTNNYDEEDANSTKSSRSAGGER